MRRLDGSVAELCVAELTEEAIGIGRKKIGEDEEDCCLWQAERLVKS